MQPLAYDIRQSVIASNRSRTRIYVALKKGELAGRKDGKRTVILARDLQAWLDQMPRFDPKAS